MNPSGKKSPPPITNPTRRPTNKSAFHQLRIYLDRLTDNQREVIILKFQQDLSYREIHAITGLTTGNIGFLIHTGLKRLREIIPDDLRS